MPHLQEAFQACLHDVSRCLEAVISCARLSQSRDVTALLQACARLRALLPLLETLPEQHEYLLRMQLQNLPDYIARVEQEASLLFQQGRRQTYANVASALLVGGLAASVCSSLGCLVALGLCLFTGSALVPATILCIMALASTIQAGFLGYWKSEDHRTPSAMRILLEQQDMVKRQGQVLGEHLMEVQRALQSREADTSSL